MFDIVLDPEFGSNPTNPVHGDLVWSQLPGELLGEAGDEEVREERRFSCHCGKSFAHEKNLHKHKATHYEDMAFHPPFLHHSTFSDH